MNPLCIYHGDCADGFASAVIVRFALSEETIDFFQGVYQQDPPDVTDRTVIMVDFSYKRDVLLQMAEDAERILIIDHHKTAEEDLVDLPSNVTTVFDMTRSGAMMTWDYFMGEQDPPRLIRHIQDRDLWQFQLEGTKEIMACVFSYPYEFDVWHNLIFDQDINYLKAAGSAILRYHMKNVHEFIHNTAYKTTIAGHEVPVVNCPYFMASDAGHVMAVGQPFSASYFYGFDGITFSLRSDEDGLDVSEIAKSFGGGGHKHAAGFKLGLDELHKVAAPIN